jgi:hypothetical protein
VMKENAVTANLLIEAGYDPDAVTDAIVAGDLSLLKGQHSGLVSVQLQQPGMAPPDATNGTTNGAPPAPVQLPKPKSAQPPRAALNASGDPWDDHEEGN